mmetsp:Transcript_17745/g.45870  ORF Transcript_17745/g.45870 Transcript_17745/m.45870 type:complete len:448 (-) Transcript_17745:538-1881(-)
MRDMADVRRGLQRCSPAATLPPGLDCLERRNLTVLRIIAVGQRGKRCAQLCGPLAHHAIADAAAVDAHDGGELTHSPRREYLIRRVKFGQADPSLDGGDANLVGEREHRGACDAGEAMVGSGREQNTVLHHEEVGGIRLGDEAIDVQHDRVRGARVVGLDFGEDVVDQVVVMDLRVDALRRVAPVGGGDQLDALLVVVGGDTLRGLPLGEDDERASVHVELGVHARRRLLAPREREADVHAVAHAVGGECLEDGVAHLLGRVHIGKVHGAGGGVEAGEVRLQFEHAPAVHAQPFPHRVTALHSRVEDGESRVLSRHEPPAPGRSDPHEEVHVPPVGEEGACDTVIDDRASHHATRARLRRRAHRKRREVIVERQRGTQHRHQLGRKRAVCGRRVLAEPAGGAVHGVVPVASPDTVAWLGPRSPCEHRRTVRHAKLGAHRVQHSDRVL